MKKAFFRRRKNNFLQPLFNGLLGFAIFGLAFGVYAITYPETQPNEISGVVGIYVGKTLTSFAGDLPQGYETANDNCQADHPGSHVCTAMEIINTYNHAPDVAAAAEGPAWINNGPPAFTQAAPNDCNGWSNNTNAFFATSWNFDINFGTAGSCNLVQPFACCK